MKTSLIAIALGVLISAPALAAAPDLPDTSRTPGDTNPDVSQDTIGTTICTSGFTAGIRPNTPVTNALKRRQLSEWGYTDKTMGHYEEDHLISLQLGGSPDSEKNLWPQHYSGKWGARTKDTLEGELKRRVCLKSPTDPDAKTDHITLKEAQDAITDDWIKAYDKYVCHRLRPALTAKIKAHCI